MQQTSNATFSPIPLPPHPSVLVKPPVAATRRRSLSRIEKDLLLLIRRSPDIGEGWCRVAPVLWKHVMTHSRPELVEREQDPAGGGRVRLTERAAIVLEYL